MEAEVRGGKMLCYWLDDEGAMNKECKQPLEPRKGKDMDSPLETPEEMQDCQHFDF